MRCVHVGRLGKSGGGRGASKNMKGINGSPEFRLHKFSPLKSPIGASIPIVKLDYLSFNMRVVMDTNWGPYWQDLCIRLFKGRWAVLGCPFRIGNKLITDSGMSLQDRFTKILNVSRGISSEFGSPVGISESGSSRFPLISRVFSWSCIYTLLQAIPVIPLY